MITVDEVIKKNAEQENEKYRNVEKSNSALTKKTTGSYLPWVILGVGALIAAWYFLIRKKGSGTNEGVSS